MLRCVGGASTHLPRRQGGSGFVRCQKPLDRRAKLHQGVRFVEKDSLASILRQEQIAREIDACGEVRGPTAVGMNLFNELGMRLAYCLVGYAFSKSKYFECLGARHL